MKQLRYTGTHQPKGMIVEVNDNEVNNLLNSGDYELLVKEVVEVKEVKEVEEVEKVEVKKYDNSKRNKSRF